MKIRAQHRLVFFFAALILGSTIIVSAETAPTAKAPGTPLHLNLSEEAFGIPVTGTYRRPTGSSPNEVSFAEFHLFPDHTYCSIGWSWNVMVSDYDEGTWSFQANQVELASSGAWEKRAGTRMILHLSPSDGPLRLQLQAPNDASRVYEKIRPIQLDEIAALREHIDYEFGKYSIGGLLKRFEADGPNGRNIELPRDGSFIVSGTPIAIKVAGAKVQADRIEFSRGFKVIRFTGHVKILSGSFVNEPDLTIFFDDRQVLPASAGQNPK